MGKLRIISITRITNLQESYGEINELYYQVR
jgi:hypothetical protein